MTAKSRHRCAPSAAFQLALILSAASSISCVAKVRPADEGVLGDEDVGGGTNVDTPHETLSDEAAFQGRPWGRSSGGETGVEAAKDAFVGQAAAADVQELVVDADTYGAADGDESLPPPAVMDDEREHDRAAVDATHADEDTGSSSSITESTKEKQQQQHLSATSVFGTVTQGAGEGHTTAGKRDDGSDNTPQAFVKSAAAVPKRNTTGTARTGIGARLEGRHNIEPPQGYALAAHVVTDPSDGLSYFATEPFPDIVPKSALASSSTTTDNHHLEIPYSDCGYSGSTTQAIPLKAGHFRHLPPGAHPQSWTTATSARAGNALLAALSGNGGHRKDPQLMIALKPLKITVSGNGGESRRFSAGDCVLLEDTVGRGHKLDPIGGEELSVLMLTLPRHHHHHQHHQHQHHGSSTTTGNVDAEDFMSADARKPGGRGDGEPSNIRPQFSSTGRTRTSSSTTGRHLSVLGLRKRGVDRGRLPRPCRSTGMSTTSTASSVDIDGNEEDANATAAAAAAAAALLSEPSTNIENVAAAILGNDLHRRRAFLGAVGLGLSVFATYFLYLVATPVLGLMGVAATFFGGAMLLDNALGAIWAEVSDLIGKVKAGSIGLLDDDDDVDGGDDDDDDKEAEEERESEHDDDNVDAGETRPGDEDVDTTL